MRRSIVILAVCFVSAVSRTAFCASGTNILHELNARTSASNSLITLQIIAQRDFASLGFASTNEAALAHVGDPIQVYPIPLGVMQFYETNKTFNGLVFPDASMAPSQHLLVPVLVGNKVKSSISLRLEGTTWVNDKLGQPDVIKAIVTVASKMPAKPPKPIFIVQFDVFDIWWVGYYDPSNELRLLTTRPLPLTPPLPANSQMTRFGMYALATTAQRYNGNPN